MNMTVTPAALAWFQEECGFQPGDYVRFFARYGGSSTIQDSYSMGFTREMPDSIGLSTVAGGITFYIVEDELWYLDGKEMTVDYRKDRDEIVYSYA
ncbi:HesB/YadR/YfhF family protein [Brevibacillus composti]|uniref:HesB/YadR/YfhF family protein n=1 Tax=Brevibacillus composti TaxID=2796470 RepID=A0A7T5JP59_9BACL|nr:HesB/YadR/YfhF family protein [Brevibacillus composti]QQE74745.1 HesB/YadR/YfhF family protein [Brevibacillus composti]QUO41829.1 HesB/YadR/YfhF family protein [Brevibacillus composti]